MRNPGIFVIALITGLMLIFSAGTVRAASVVIEDYIHDQTGGYSTAFASSVFVHDLAINNSSIPTWKHSFKFESLYPNVNAVLYLQNTVDVITFDLEENQCVERVWMEFKGPGERVEIQGTNGSYTFYGLMSNWTLADTQGLNLGNIQQVKLIGTAGTYDDIYIQVYTDIVPEPASIFLLTAGGLMLRKRRK